jgi:hypothetical protein
VAYLLNAGINQPGKLPLLVNGHVTRNKTRAVAKQRTHATVEELLGVVSPMRSTLRLRKESIVRCEFGSWKPVSSSHKPVEN